MDQYQNDVKSYIRDKRLHIILIGAIIILSGIIIFFLNRYYSEDQIEKFFIFNASKLEAERSLQKIKEDVLPGAIKVPILIYHSVRPHTSFETELMKYYDVAPESLEKQFGYLKYNGYTVISFDNLINTLTKGTPLPKKSVVLNFDDGWENQYQYAFPILKRYHYTATFFIYTDPIDANDSFLTGDQILEMDSAGMTFGGHTRSHPYLFEIRDTNLLRQEIIGGKNIIEDRLGHKIDIFAYPFGWYNDQIIKVLKEAGFKAARSTYSGIYQTSQDIFKLKGIEVTDDFDKFTKDLNNN